MPVHGSGQSIPEELAEEIWVLQEDAFASGGQPAEDMAWFPLAARQIPDETMLGI